MNHKKKQEKEIEKEFEFDIFKAASATDCTGLIPRPVLTEDEAESYQEIYNVYQPDGTKNPPGE